MKFLSGWTMDVLKRMERSAEHEKRQIERKSDIKTAHKNRSDILSFGCYWWCKQHFYTLWRPVNERKRNCKKEQKKGNRKKDKEWDENERKREKEVRERMRDSGREKIENNGHWWRCIEIGTKWDCTSHRCISLANFRSTWVIVDAGRLSYFLS